MIDIHSHILFGVDDGAKTIEDSLALIEEMYNQGVKIFILTPHRRKNMFEKSKQEIEENFKKLKQAVKEKYNDLIRIYLGTEIYYTEDIPDKIERNEIHSMAGTRNVLVEFNYGIRTKDLEDAIYNIVTLGKTPIIAHIERYDCLEKNDETILNLIELGAKMQVNAESILKINLFGDNKKVYKKRAKYFLENDLVDIIASDAHNLSTRKPYMKKAYDIIVDKYGKKRAENLFYKTPARIMMERD
jgi:tyrosine-protein phosphatase cpsB